ncbi:efflux transporter outer membrane subunit [Pelagicoccus sp. SDUM812002]|uniref:efflux transporter outer membrane subunit n=1 Tax=Pelagicoccus sp. SDUM812002 TaxID=3041266 RepID=UPI00280F9E0B|nr:efflux transporter outer membrane subunit [Pelagicoccus sp. SDUM812002]MDQ8186250.1 efflux transporter outer membrane subunit [Pelagicoccus sp. SDUM812002]
MHNRIITFPVIAAALSLSGCAALQPTLPQPNAQIGEQWQSGNTQSPPADRSLDIFGSSNASDVGWRNFFTDPNLEQLIELSLENNRDLRAAALNVQRARAQYRIQRSDRLPSVNGTAAMTRTGGDALPETEQYEANLGIASYEIDLFGRAKNLSDAALQNYFATEEAQRSVQLSLIAEVANAYLTLSSDLELQRIAQATLETYREQFDISSSGYELGSVSSLELSQVETLLASARADLALYSGQIAQDTSALSLLVGRPVTSDLLPDSFDLQVSGLAPLSAGVPSETLFRRPDLQRMEHQLRAANANLAAARAAFFPSISLTGTVGSLSGELSDLFEDNTGTWSFIPQIRVPIFQAGKLRANRDVAKIDREITLATYEKTIQTGFKEVSDALTFSSTLAQRRQAIEALVEAASKTQSLSEKRYQAGRDSYLTLLDSQRTLYSARQALVQSLLREQSNRIELYKVLGGGWNEES